MSRCVVVVACLFALVCGCTRPSGNIHYQDDAALVIEHARVYPGAGSAAVGPVTVVVANGRIAEMTTAAVAPSGARRIDAREGLLLPGLIDAHTHVAGSFAPTWKPRLPNAAANLERLLYAGITTVLDLGDPLRQLQKLRSRLRAGELIGPDLYFSGPHFGPRHGHPAAVVEMMLPWPLDWMIARAFSFQIETVADVENALAELEEVGADVVKVTVDELPAGVPVLADELLHAVVRGAHRQGRRVFAHIGTVTDALRAIDAGVDVLAHNVYKHALTDVDTRRIAAAGVTVVTTSGVFDRSHVLLNEGGIDTFSPLERELAPDLILDALRAVPVDEEIPDAMRRWLDVLRRSRSAQAHNVVALWRAGVPIAVGTDAAIAGWVPGAAFHLEMATLADAGLPPWAILQAATSGAAKALGLADRGTIAVGMRADLLLVDGDPLVEIRDSDQIRAVIRGGRLVHRAGPIH